MVSTSHVFVSEAAFRTSWGLDLATSTAILPSTHLGAPCRSVRKPIATIQPFLIYHMIKEDMEGTGALGAHMKPVMKQASVEMGLFTWTSLCWTSLKQEWCAIEVPTRHMPGDTWRASSHHTRTAKGPKSDRKQWQSCEIPLLPVSEHMFTLWIVSGRRRASS